MAKDDASKVGQISSALVNAQKEIHGVLKNKSGIYDNEYADLGEIIKAVQPALNKNGIAISHEFGISQDHKILYVITNLIHESGERISNKIGMPIIKNDPHQIGSLITYGRRYGLSSIISLGQYDDDGTGAMGGCITDDHKKAFNDMIQHPIYEGKKTAIKKKWAKLKTAHDAESALQKMNDKISDHENAEIAGSDEDHSDQINAELDQQMNQAMEGDN